LGADVLTPEDDDRRAGIVIARFPGHAGDAIAAALNGAGVVVSPRLGSVRFSLHVFNDSTDVTRALDVLADVVS
jgi:selenocysteine lyase/cysteine desulfurase